MPRIVAQDDRHRGRIRRRQRLDRRRAGSRERSVVPGHGGQPPFSGRIGAPSRERLQAGECGGRQGRGRGIIRSTLSGIGGRRRTRGRRKDPSGLGHSRICASSPSRRRKPGICFGQGLFSIADPDESQMNGGEILRDDQIVEVPSQIVSTKDKGSPFIIRA
ncbi:hypothetical protein B8V81_0459 [Paenibacillus pasadenensis]|uniref:Uncharacterized protein n=1 Tax=Paenibacillus pasadenensis TaxID=217090 RepID=A0A2N5ND98_9BACL|nr:hypothetical protein B8V81_0459 [Paenibacillus pasadenensis]